ncbi:MAG: sodium:solute symporter [Acidobacteriota bacterium]
MPVADLIVLGAYFLGILGLGAYFLRRNRNTEAFMAAGRALPGWLCGMSILATYVSSISFLALPGSAYELNWSRFVFSLSIAFAAWMATRFFVPLYRHRGSISAYSYLEDRFGPPARIYASSFYLLTQLFRMVVVMYLMALPLSVLLGWPVWIIICITGASVALYTIMGGIEAVIWTDAVQGFVLIGGALLCVILLLVGMPEGPGQLFAIAFEHQKFSLGEFRFDLAETTFWVILLNGIFINLQNFGIDQNYIQRYISSSSEAEAKKAVWIGALLYIPVSLLFFFIGTGLYAYYTAQPHLLPQDLVADRVFPHFIVTALPPGLSGLMIAAIFAAAMSTVSTSLNSLATIFLADYYERFFRPTAGEKEKMLALYGFSIFLGVLATYLAVKMIDVRSALDVWWTFSSIFSGGMLGLFLLGYFSRRADNRAAIIGMSVGLLSIAWMVLSRTEEWSRLPWIGAYRNPLHDWLVIVVGTAIIFLVAEPGSRLLAGRAKE